MNTVVRADFSHYAPKIWNMLPEDIRDAEAVLKS